MTKINVGELDAKLRAAGIPLDGVALLDDGSIRLDLQGNPTNTVIQQAQAIVAEYNQDSEDAAKQVQNTKDTGIIAALPDSIEVKGAKTVGELADQVAKQGELLALIAAKMGLV